MIWHCTVLTKTESPDSTGTILEKGIVRITVLLSTTPFPLASTPPQRCTSDGLEMMLGGKCKIHHCDFEIYTIVISVQSKGTWFCGSLVYFLLYWLLIQ